jgi:phosphatidylserine/phosphatidylglycerophosphate/cardiolipin synthase-like enzyme
MSAGAAGATARSIVLLEDGAYYDYLIEAIRSAKRSVWAHVFSFNLRPPDDCDLIVRGVARALGDASKKGTDVRILLGGHAQRALTLPAGNMLTARFLTGLGVDCRIYNSKGTRDSHAKFFLVDGAVLVCGSHNWSPRALARGVDTSIAVESPAVVGTLRPFFMDAWKQGERLRNPGRELISGVPLASVLCDPAAYDSFRNVPKRDRATSHEGSVRCLPDGDYYKALIASIRGARRTIRVSMFFFSNPTNKRHPNYALIGELLRAHGRGVDIRIVLDADRETDIYHSRRINAKVQEYLTSKGIAVRFDAPDSVNHSKFLVADEDKVLVGSHNWTAGSFHRLHDLSLEVHSEGIAALCTGFVDRHFGPGR